MKTRLMKYSLAAGLLVLLALPAAAYSQLGPRGPRFAAGDEGPQRMAGGNFETRRGAVAAQGARRGFGRRPARRGGVGGGRSGLALGVLAHGEQIGLTEEQHEQISAAQRGHQETSINRRAETQIAELELRDLMRADMPDVGAVEAKMRELSEQGIAQRTGALRLDAAVAEILTTEQIGQLGELRRDRRDRAGRRMRGDRVNRGNRGNRGNRVERVNREGRGSQNRRGAPSDGGDSISAR